MVEALIFISSVCDTDPSCLEEKSENVRHEGGSQMMLYLRSVKFHRTSYGLYCSFKDNCFSTVDLLNSLQSLEIFIQVLDTQCFTPCDYSRV